MDSPAPPELRVLRGTVVHLGQVVVQEYQEAVGRVVLQGLREILGAVVPLGHPVLQGQREPVDHQAQEERQERAVPQEHPAAVGTLEQAARVVHLVHQE